MLNCVQEWKYLIFFLGGFSDFVSCPEEAVLLMKEQQEKGCKYRAIITDFHMAPIDGKDFLRIVFDRFGYALTRDSSFRDTRLEELSIKSFEDLEKEFHIANRDVLNFVAENFSDLNDYRKFLRYWNNLEFEILKVIFAGAERGDYTDDRELELAYFKKSANSEEAILDLLCSNGVLPPDVYGSFFDYERFDPNRPKEEKKFKPGKKLKIWRTSDL